VRGPVDSDLEGHLLAAPVVALLVGYTERYPSWTH
jgi:hypothetical protein